MTATMIAHAHRRHKRPAPRALYLARRDEPISHDRVLLVAKPTGTADPVQCPGGAPPLAELFAAARGYSS